MAQNPDVIIIGAGLAGLTAAYALKRQGIPYKIIEASDQAGGRAQTVTMPHGAVVNTGANWLHSGEKNPIFPLIKELGIPFEDDKISNNKMVSYYNEKRHEGVSFRNRMKRLFYNPITTLGAYISDTPLKNVAMFPRNRKIIERFIPIWLGVDAKQPHQASLQEMLYENSHPGGLQLEGGIKSLIDRLVQEVGEENIIYNAAVEKISEGGHSGGTVVKVQQDGKTYNYAAKYAIFTGSIGVLKNRDSDIELPPAATRKLQPYLDGLTMGKFAKAVIEIDPEFFKNKPHLRNMHIDLLDGEPPAFCHINTSGQNTLTLMVGGDAAEKLEKMKPDAALELIKKKLEPAAANELQGYEAFIQGKPLLTGWMQNQYTRGSYSARSVGGKREQGLQAGNILFAGEAFHKTMSGTLAGAYESGQYAAQQVIAQLTEQAKTRGDRPR